MTIEHKSIADAELHEPKGAAGATVNQTLRADGAGAATFLTAYSSGVYNYSNTESAITLTPTDTDVQMTNDGLGTNTNTTYSIPDADDIWDTVNDEFDFTDLSLGDTVLIRVDIDLVSTGANTTFIVSLDAGIGGTPYTLNMGQIDFKASGTYTNEVFSTQIFMGNTNTLNNPAQIMVQSDTGTATAEINGFAMTVIKRSPVYA